ncbi:MAG: MFS transporter [Lautropia sp.]|nr:MFS transporter [Lautropia sp.]
MFRSIWSISSLLIGLGILLVGSGLLGMLIGLRGVNAGFSNITLGMMMTGYYVGYISGAWICPRIIRRVGHVRCFASFAALCAALTLTYGMVVDPWVWFGLRVLNGLSIMGIYMVIESWLNERSQANPGTQGSIFAVYMMVTLVTVAIGQYMIAFYGANALESFVIAAILFCLGLLPISLTPVPQPLPITAPSLSLKSLAKYSPTGVAGSFCSGLVLGSFWALTAIYGRGLGFTDIDIANFTAAAIFGGALLQWPIGWCSDHFDRRKVLTVVAIGATLTLLALSELEHLMGGKAPPNAYVAVSAIMGIFIFSLYGLSVAQTVDRVPASEALEATRGLLLLHGIGAAIGPMLSGTALQILGERGFPQATALMTLLLAIFAFVRTWLEAPVPIEERSPFQVLDQTSPVAMEMHPHADAPLADNTPETPAEEQPAISPEEAEAAAVAAIATAHEVATVAAEAASTAGEATEDTGHAADAGAADADESAGTANEAESAGAKGASPTTTTDGDTDEHGPVQR